MSIKGNLKVVKLVNDVKELVDVDIITQTSNISDFKEGVKEAAKDLNLSGSTPKRETKDTFLTANPVLSDGIFAIESDTGRIKMGDGNTVYSLLPYIGFSNGISEAYMIMATSEKLTSKNPTPPKNTYIFESDTSLMKKSTSGMVAYSNLGYTKYTSKAVADSDNNSKVIANYSSIFTEYDFLPSDGQIVVEVDTRKFKIGDGVTLYSALEYQSSTCELISNITSDTNIPVLDTVANFTASSTVPATDKVLIVVDEQTITKVGDGSTDFFSLSDSTLVCAYNDTDYDFANLIYEDEDLLEASSATEIANPVLSDGEMYIGISYTYSLKIGDGSNTFADLSYDENTIYCIPSSIFVFDTAANFAASNIILPNGRIGIETDTNKFKLGNGITTWENTMYQNTLTI